MASHLCPSCRKRRCVCRKSLPRPFSAAFNFGAGILGAAVSTGGAVLATGVDLAGRGLSTGVDVAGRGLSTGVDVAGRGLSTGVDVAGRGLSTGVGLAERGLSKVFYPDSQNDEIEYKRQERERNLETQNERLKQQLRNESSKNQRAVPERRRYSEKDKSPVDERTCIVCMTEAAEIAFSPCGHAQTCAPCAELVDVCPLCRSGIESRLRVFY
eukprot:715268_1